MIVALCTSSFLCSIGSPDFLKTLSFRFVSSSSSSFPCSSLLFSIVVLVLLVHLQMKVSDCKRVVLLSYDSETNVVEFRHYAVDMKPLSLSRSVRKLVQVPHDFFISLFFCCLISEDFFEGVRKHRNVSLLLFSDHMKIYFGEIENIFLSPSPFPCFLLRFFPTIHAFVYGSDDFQTLDVLMMLQISSSSTFSCFLFPALIFRCRGLDSFSATLVYA